MSVTEAVCISETVIIALITFASGVVGAVIGGITAYKVAKFSATKNISQALYSEKQRAYAELLDSYNVFSGAIAASIIDKTWLTDAEERSLYTRFQSAYAKAILVCSAETALELTAFIHAVNRYAAERDRPEDLHDLFQRVVSALRRELHEDIG